MYIDPTSTGNVQKKRQISKIRIINYGLLFCIISLLALIAYQLFFEHSQKVNIIVSKPIAPSTYRVNKDQIRNNAEWLLNSQMPDGAIASYVDRAKILPYLSNFGASGLAKATTMLGDQKYLKASWSWLNWYQEHMDNNGFVTDYIVTPKGYVSTGDMDSTDSYAATYLRALSDAYNTEKDLEQLKLHRNGISMAVSAIEATMQPDGLTWTKPSYKAKYLMDEVETLDGLHAAESLAKDLGNAQLAHRISEDARKLSVGIESLWNEQDQAYDWALHENGKKQKNDWKNFYPDANQQIWTAAFDISKPPRSDYLAKTYLKYQPKWADPAAVVNFDTGPHKVEYWPIVGWGLVKTNNKQEALDGLQSIETYAASKNYEWPFHAGTAGQLLILQSMLIDYNPTR